MVKHAIEEKLRPGKIIILDTAGVSSLYANDGGIIVRFEESDESFVVFASANNYIQKGLIFSVTYVKDCNIIVEIQQI